MRLQLDGRLVLWLAAASGMSREAMAIRFIHTGDWHIAKPFRRFEEEKAALLRDQRQRIPERIGELARGERAGHVLVAGDIFDTALPADASLRRLAARLGQFPEIQWHLLPGNHDPATPNGLWRRFEELGLPENVRVYHEPAVVTLGEGAELLASPLRSRHVAHDPTAWMDDRETRPGVIRVGLAHGAVQGFGSAGEAGVLLDPGRAEKARLDYLALGDWHGTRQIGPRTWYAGTPEPDQFPANEPGFALAVEIEAAGAPPRVTRHRTARFIWRRCVLEGDVAARLAAIEAELVAAGTAAADQLLSIACAGRVSLEEEAGIRAAVERIADLVFHVEARLADLVIDTAQPPGELFDDAMMRAVAARLMQRITDEGRGDAVAGRALRLLHEMAGAAGRRG
jgi:hypothetical protein